MHWEIEAYQKLCKSINDSIETVSYCEMMHCKTVVVFGIGSFRAFEKFFISLKKINHNVKIIIITQTHKIERYEKYLNGEYKFIEWNQNFSLRLLDVLREDMRILKPDAMVYFAKAPNDLDNLNILELGKEMSRISNADEKFSVYCVDIVCNKLYRYRKTSLTYQGLQLYQSINDYLMEI